MPEFYVNLFRESALKCLTKKKRFAIMSATTENHIKGKEEKSKFITAFTENRFLAERSER